VIDARRSGRRLAGVAAWASAALLAALSGPLFAAEKVSVPIDGRLAPESVVIGLGATARFRLELTTTADLKQVAVRLKVPEGMSLVTGPARAQIVDFVPGQTRVFEYALRLDAGGEKKVWVEAEVLGLGTGSVLRRMFLGVVNPVEPRNAPEAVIRGDGRGNSYQVQGIPQRPSP